MAHGNRRLFCIASLLLAPQFDLAAEQPDETREAYVEAVDGDILIRPALNYNQLSLLIFDQTKDNNTLVSFKPNNTLFTRVDVGYKGFGLGGSFNIPGSEKDKAEYGETRSTDFQFYYYGRKFGADIVYQRYEGFYAELGGVGGAFTTGLSARGDLKMSNIGANAYYVFSDNFSMPASFRQTERQKKLAYSFLLGGTVSHYTIAADRSLIPQSHQAAFAEYGNYSGGKYTNLSVMPGFGITVVPDNYHFYMSLVVLAGIGMTYADTQTTTGAVKKMTDNYKVNAKYSAGYNGDNIFGGASIVLDLSAAATFSKSTLNVGSGVIFIEVFAGIRFHSTSKKT